MNIRQILSIGLFSACLFGTAEAKTQVVGMEQMRSMQKAFPRIHAIDKDVEAVKAKIDKYVNHHVTDPQWILSRMAMYWKDGEHYTQCYLKNMHWVKGEGNAPVPTLRMPGQRIWNKWKRPSLENLKPYNETGDLLCVNPNVPNGKPTLIPYNETGHSVRSINGEILELGVNAAYVYWKTKEERYARFATDIFNQTLLGIYYMNPIINLTPKEGGEGGWKPGGIIGYYDYEQIHDDIAMRLALIYDYAFGYLQEHPSGAMKLTGKDTRKIMNEVMRRFVDLGMIRGGKTGNWNVNGWNIMLYPILVMEDNSYFEDSKGKEYFLHYLVEESTSYHNCIPDMLVQYDPVTGLWPESPGYGFSTVLNILSWQRPLMNAGIDVISKYDILRKAAGAIPVWSDSRGNMLCFGDYRGGKIGTPDMQNKETRKASSYSPFHRMAVLKNFDDPSFPMMACLYGGRKGAHLSENGLAAQFYGFGYALAADASAYESYWSEDYKYHQSVEGSNTIIPGYTHGEVTLNAMEPKIDPTKEFYSTEIREAPFADMSAGEKRRKIMLVKVGKGKGYYVDIFKPGVDSSRYIMHTVGRSVEVSNQKKDGSCVAFWDVSDSIAVRLWVSGGTKRHFSTKMNPATYADASLTPNGVSTGAGTTPTFYSQQEEPIVYANIYEPYAKGKPTIKIVKWRYKGGQPIEIVITHMDGSKKRISVF